MTKRELLNKYKSLIGRPVRMGDEPDRMITEILHEESGGVCVATGELHRFSFSDGQWAEEPHSADALNAIGKCDKKRRGAK